MKRECAESVAFFIVEVISHSLHPRVIRVARVVHVAAVHLIPNNAIMQKKTIKARNDTAENVLKTFM